MIDPALLQQVKSAGNFEQRVQVLEEFYTARLQQYKGNLATITIVTGLIQQQL